MEHSAQLNEHGLYDIYSLWHTPWWQTRLFYGVVLALIILLCVLLCWRLFKRFRTAAVRKNSWDIALLELETLKKIDVSSVEKTKMVYGQLCWILKKYLSSRFGVRWEEKTEQEIIAMLEHSSYISAEQLGELQEIFNGGVLVKFANVSVMREHTLADVQRAQALVRATIPSPQKASSAANS